MKETASIRSPFKFLDPYVKEDRSIFFGRDKEIEALYEHTFLSKLMLVYGASGTGKTSLVNCGLRNRFTATDWLAVEVRRGNHIVESLFQALQERSQRGLSDGRLPIEQLVGELYQEYFIPVYLLFDQFEELFIQGEKEEQQAFFQTLQRLLESDVPCKIILILREEYLAFLSDFEMLVPALFDNRFRIEPMNQRQLEEVVHKTVTASQFGIVFEAPEENTQRILHNLRDERNEVELTNLQVYLDRLYKSDLARRCEEGADRPITFDRPLIEKLGKLPEVLSVFLDEQLSGLDHELDLPGLGLEILAGFVTNDGTKRHRREPEAAESLQVRRRISPEEASRLTSLVLEGLVEGRLLRPMRIQEEVRYELSHDLLAGQVFERFSAEEKALRKAERLLQSNYELHQDIRRHDEGASKYLTEQELALVEPYLPAIEGEPGLQAYFAESREDIHKRQDAERLRLEAKASKEKKARERAERLKNEAERGRHRARWLAVAAIVVALIALVAGFLALRQKKIADMNAIEVVDVLIEQARELIFKCEYENALAKLLKGANLVNKYPPLGRAFIELAFFYGEAGKAEEALDLATTVALLLGKPAKDFDSFSNGNFSNYSELSRYRTALRSLDSIGYDSAFQRYYPMMISVQGGTFTMGCDTLRDNSCDDDEMPPHQVTLSSFQLTQTETTVWQYSLYCAVSGQDSIQRTKYGGWTLDGNTPVIYVSWYDAARYANWLSQQMGEDTAYTFVSKLDEYNWEIRLNPNAKEAFRLPTEAEWEYAARGGFKQDTFIYSGSNELDEVAWYSYNAARTVPVATTRKANGLGIYDMSGNVWEWCWDWYERDYFEKIMGSRDPKGPDNGSSRVVRGGSWDFFPDGARCSFRGRDDPNYRSVLYGFRLARTGGQ